MRGETPAAAHRLAVRVTRYQASTVDLRPWRAVHAPDLNACLSAVQCRAVHFGYGVPVRLCVLPPPHSHLACLLLDADDELSPEALRYLLNCHPQCRRDESPTKKKNNSTSTPNGQGLAVLLVDGHKQQTSPPVLISSADLMLAAPGSGSLEQLLRRQGGAQEDVAAIAKHISDHAEMLYQSWKARGVAPTEVLNRRAPGVASPVPSTTSSSSASTANRMSPVDLLASPDLEKSLEELVSSFVQEDKARHQQNQRAGSKSPVLFGTSSSAIQSALERFERGASDGTKVILQKPQPIYQQPQQQQQQAWPANRGASKAAEQQQIQQRERTTGRGRFIPREGDVLASSGTTTWPLKTRVPTTSPSTTAITTAPERRWSTLMTRGGVGGGVGGGHHQQVLQLQQQLPQPQEHPSQLILEPSQQPAVVQKHQQHQQQQQQQPQLAMKTPQMKQVERPSMASSLPSAAILAEVDREEEKLIHALRTGTVIADHDDSTASSFLLRAREEKRRQQSPSPSPSPTSPTPTPSSPVTTSVAAAAAAAAAAAPSRKGPPHPELTWQQKQHLKERVPSGASAMAMAAAAVSVGGGTGGPLVAQGPPGMSGTGTSASPVRPFLTRGSVAERVLLFERCPVEVTEKRRGSSGSTGSASTTGSSVSSRPQTHGREEKKTSLQGASPAVSLSLSSTSLSPRSTTPRAGKSSVRSLQPISPFHYPMGRPLSPNEIESSLQRVAAAIASVSGTNGGQQLGREQMAAVAKACDLPLYCKMPLFLAAGGGEKKGTVSAEGFLDMWRKIISSCHDLASRFIRLLTRNARNTLSPEDFVPLVQDVVDTHPGLAFLRDAKEFHSRYVHTVIARIYYCTNRSWSGRISINELRRSNFLSVLSALEEEEDINQITDYFSYEHFYVIYCKFWELDKDHDLFIDKNDLACHNDHAVSSRMIDRIFSGAVTRGGRAVRDDNRMSYTEFVWFLLSEEDKRHPTAIEYWFRCMDLDGDGFLSMYELEYFYAEQLQRLESLGIETLPFHDCLCQMLDMIQPAHREKISLADLKRCKMTPVFFDTFFNMEKYLDHEQRDPFASQREHDGDGPEMSDWDRYAAEEYELLVAEEGGAEPQDELELKDDTVVEVAVLPQAQLCSTAVTVKVDEDDDESGGYVISCVEGLDEDDDNSEGGDQEGTGLGEKDEHEWEAKNIEEGEESFQDVHREDCRATSGQ